MILRLKQCFIPILLCIQNYRIRILSISLLQKNYTVIVNDNGKIPEEEISSANGIVKRRFLPTR